MPTLPLESLTAGRPMPPLARALIGLGLLLAKWEERRMTRLGLSRLDPHLLRDIGLDARAAEVETAKPFWRG